MAVTVQSQAASYSPAFNNMWFIATSTQIAQPKFKYRVVCTDVLTGFPITEDYTQNPSGELEFDAIEFCKLKMLNFLPVNLYGWQKCSGSSRKVTVNIGEVYGAGVPVYYPGTNTTHIVWNASLELFDFATYYPYNYVYDSTAPSYNFISALNEKTFIDRSNYLYALVAEGSTTNLTTIGVQTYNATGGFIGGYQINRPSYATGVYTDQHQCIDVGYKGLLNIPAGQVTVFTGAYPIITTAVAYYLIVNQDTGATIKKIYVDCSQNTVYSLHYLNRKGGYNTLHCDLISDLTTTKTSTSFKKSGWSRSGYVKVLDQSGAVEKTLSVTTQEGVKVRSNFISQSEIDLHKDLFSSPDVRLDLGSSTVYKSVKITNGTYLSKNWDFVRNLEFDLTFSHSNGRQKG